ncbi:MAG: AMP-binding protein, partial [Mailhella sp.]|nr:AMP-binding protein [Mailhella sp.]
KPKGVMLTNHNLINFVDDNAKNREIQGYTKRGSVLLTIAALTFDLSVMDEFVPLGNGMTSVLATQEQIMNPALLKELMLRNQADIMSCTPSYLSNLVIIDSFLPAIRRLKIVFIGAEAFPPALFGKLREVNPKLYIMNGYGPTEPTVSCTMDVIESGEDITIGTPGANVHVATLDRDGRLQPPGAMGELVIMGDGVGRGYIGREDLTKKSFITLLGKRAYRSGDLVRIREDGRVEFHGRMDNQVKLRGLRIELGEIESVLNSYPGVRSSIVLVLHSETDYLGAWFTADSEIPISDLKAHLSSRLTAYMIPQAFMQLPEMPLTANGKIDKKALPPLTQEEERITDPETELQERLLTIAKEVIGSEKIGVDTDLFTVGLSSISCIRLIALAEERFGLTVRIQELFESRTVRRLEEILGCKEADEAYALRTEYPLSMTQMGIYVDSVRLAGTTAYNIPFLYRLGDGIDIKRLRDAISHAFFAHPCLFMTLRQMDSGDVVSVRNAPEHIDIPVDDTLPPIDELVLPFDLRLEEPLYRVRLFDTKDGKYLFMDTHHIISDGASIDILMEDIETSYEGGTVDGETYTGFEYALDEEMQRTTDRYERAKDWYEKMLTDAEHEMLPEGDKEGGEEAQALFVHDTDITLEAVSAFCEANGVTENAFFNAVFSFVLSAFTGRQEAFYATIYNGRMDPRLSRAVTMLVKTFPVRIQVTKSQSIKAF